jgi:hypothetical protein
MMYAAISLEPISSFGPPGNRFLFCSLLLLVIKTRHILVPCDLKVTRGKNCFITHRFFLKKCADTLTFLPAHHRISRIKYEQNFGNGNKGANIKGGRPRPI